MHRMMWAGTVRALSFADQLRATRLAGCTLLSVTPLHYTAWLGSGISTRDMLAMAADEGIRLNQLDPIARWHGNWRPEGVPASLCPPGFLAFDTDDFFRIAEALQVERISAIVTGPAGKSELGKLIEDYAALCDRAASAGLYCDLEFIPLWALPDLKTAWHVVNSVDRMNSGIIFDIWHYIRGTPDSDLLLQIPGEKIASVQISDGLADPYDGDMLADCLQHRQIPGDGFFPIVPLLHQLDTIGALQCVGMELFSEVMDKLPSKSIATICRDAFTRLGLDR